MRAVSRGLAAGSRIARWGWGALGVLALLAAWQWGHYALGPFVLPSLQETGRALWRLVAEGLALPALAATAGHALGGFLVGGVAGLALGLAGGLVTPVGAMVAPVLVMILGTPPIAWVVLALLWFGPGGGAPAFTVAVTAAPIVFLAALQGVRSRDPRLDEMARVYRAPARMRASDLILPALADHLAPAFATALAFSFKVAVMAEVLSGSDGVGGGIANARAYLDLAETMAWIVLVVAFLLLADAVLLAPLRGWLAARDGASAAVPMAGG
ncbi:ABC transporter permease subunit [Xanthobacter sp. V0B-10]|uniref:ABC transporter permease n=1 Tax=Xanthobacter albus TaxID=3119929 RepID=UPI0037280B92